MTRLQFTLPRFHDTAYLLTLTLARTTFAAARTTLADARTTPTAPKWILTLAKWTFTNQKQPFKKLSINTYFDVKVLKIRGKKVNCIEFNNWFD